VRGQAVEDLDRDRDDSQGDENRNELGHLARRLSSPEGEGIGNSAPTAVGNYEGHVPDRARRRIGTIASARTGEMKRDQTGSMWAMFR
jgi:hypothetical protein